MIKFPFLSGYYHHVPVRFSRFFPMVLVSFVAETKIGIVPVFNVTVAGAALHAYVRATHKSASQTQLILSYDDYVLKPYMWLLDNFGLKSVRDPHEFVTYTTTK